MTAIDTSPEAVERYAKVSEMEGLLKVADTLRALDSERSALQRDLEKAREDLSIIRDLASHHIPYHTYGDSEAACDMANRMSRIAAIASQGASP